jgi:hypothetical protein
MKQRCLNPNNAGYKNYGGRGIRICKGLLSFEKFIGILGKRPEKYTLDRIDNNGNYSCGNCFECIQYKWILNIRWTTWSIQGNNKRRIGRPKKVILESSMPL